MKYVKIKRIFSADFRKSPRTIFDDVRTQKRLWAGELGANEAYVFVSSTGNQMLFILGDTEVVVRPGTHYESQQRLLDYRCWRIEGSTFHPSMIEDYARSVGLTFGLKTLSEQYRERRSL